MFGGLHGASRLMVVPLGFPWLRHLVNWRMGSW